MTTKSMLLSESFRISVSASPHNILFKTPLCKGFVRSEVSVVSERRDLGVIAVIFIVECKEQGIVSHVLFATVSIFENVFDNRLDKFWDYFLCLYVFLSVRAKWMSPFVRGLQASLTC